MSVEQDGWEKNKVAALQETGSLRDRSLDLRLVVVDIPAALAAYGFLFTFFAANFGRSAGGIWFVRIGFPVLSAVVCLLIGMLVAPLVTLIVSGVLASLGMTPRSASYGAILGGSTSLVLCFPILPTLYEGQLPAFLLGPLLFGMFGQMGGAHGGWRYHLRDRPRSAGEKGRLRDTKFGIKFLLVFTTWTAGLFCVLRIFGVLETPAYVVGLVAWIAFQLCVYFFFDFASARTSARVPPSAS